MQRVTSKQASCCVRWSHLANGISAHEEDCERLDGFENGSLAGATWPHNSQRKTIDQRGLTGTPGFSQGPDIAFIGLRAVGLVVLAAVLALLAAVSCYCQRCEVRS